MNAAEIILRDFDVSQSTNPTDALLNAMLVYVSTDYEGGDTFANPVREVLRRLEARGVGKIAIDLVAQKLNQIESKYPS